MFEQVMRQGMFEQVMRLFKLAEMQAEILGDIQKSLKELEKGLETMAEESQRNTDNIIKGLRSAGTDAETISH